MASKKLIASAAFVLFLVGWQLANGQPVPGANWDETAMSGKDVKLNQAKEAYAKQVAEVDQSVSQMIEEALRQARNKAHEVKEERLKNARTELLNAYETAIKRATTSGDLDYASRLTIEKESIIGKGIKASDVKLDLIQNDGLYKCVLGIYGRYARDTRYPIVNLSVPNRDLWSKSIQSKLRGRIDFHEINYLGDAKLIILEDGIYTLEIPGRGTGVELNGKTLNSGDVELRQGVYKVRITTGTHGQPYLPDSFVRFFFKKTKKQVELVNSGADIKKFLSRMIDGQKVVEVSGYQPEAVDLETNTQATKLEPTDPLATRRR